MKRKATDQGSSRSGTTSFGTGHVKPAGRKFSRVGAPGTQLRTGGFSASFGSKPGEKKFYDKGVALTAVNSTGFMTLLHSPPSGPGFGQRIGRKTTATQVYIRGTVGVQNGQDGTFAAVVTPAQQIRMILFVDMQANAAQPTFAELLNSATPGPSTQLNPDNRDRFKILKDKVWVFDPVTASGGAFNRTIASLKIFKKLPNIETIFKGDTSTEDFSVIQTGGIWLAFIGDQASAADQQGAAKFTSRVRYLDN